MVNSVGTEAAGWTGIAASAVEGIVGVGVFDEAIAPKPEEHFFSKPARRRLQN